MLLVGRGAAASAASALGVESGQSTGAPLWAFRWLVSSPTNAMDQEDAELAKVDRG